MIISLLGVCVTPVQSLNLNSFSTTSKKPLPHEEYEYSMSFYGIPVGDAAMSWSSRNGVTTFTGSMRTNLFADLIFSIDNAYWSIFDEKSGNLLGTGSRINQANLSLESSIAPDDTQVLQPNLFSMFNHLRWQETMPGDSINYVFNENNIEYIATGFVDYASRMGEISITLSIARVGHSQVRTSSDLLRNHFADEGNVWHFSFSEDSRRIPLSIRFRKGSITVAMKLKYQKCSTDLHWKE